MKLRVPASKKRASHFYHVTGAKTCVASQASKKQYGFLKPASPDPVAAAALRAAFKGSWEKHWYEFTSITDYGDVDEFIEMLGRANRLRLWEYKGILSEHIPFLLVALGDFPRENSIYHAGTPKRAYYLRFWFAGQIRSFEGRWNALAKPPDLYQAQFINPGTGKRPPASTILTVVAVPTGPGFLSRTVARSAYVSSKMDAFFKRHPRLFP